MNSAFSISFFHLDSPVGDDLRHFILINQYTIVNIQFVMYYTKSHTKNQQISEKIFMTLYRIQHAQVRR
jgi:hypothetical protein